MVKKSKIAIFEGKRIRRHWDQNQEKWYFSVVDVVQVLTDQVNFTKARKYWNKLAERLRAEGSEVVTKCHRLNLFGYFKLASSTPSAIFKRVSLMKSLISIN